MSRLTFSMIFLLVAVSSTPITWAIDKTTQKAPEITHEKYALLVGCSEYQTNGDELELWGPANDVPIFAKMLSEKFKFQKKNITQLTRWPDDKTKRPSYKNIVAGFENLVKKSKPGTKIVILMNGHGTQVPIPANQKNALDPKNPEPDGMDEVFLPADFKPFAKGKFENSIYDNQIRNWLDAMKKRGASVWIIFDCCHSGTMTRGLKDIERQRTLPVNYTAKMIPDALIKEANKKSQVARKQLESIQDDVDVPLALDDKSTDSKNVKEKNGGSITAFYAAQSYEKAPELPFPKDAEPIKKNYYGLFTYVITQTINKTSTRLSYRDLARRITAEYRAQRGSRYPTPLFDGNMDVDVLGAGKWPRLPLFLEQFNGKARLSVGLLSGITTGTILSVSPPAGNTPNETKIVGYIEVTEVMPSYCKIKSVPYEKQKAVTLSKFPNSSRCRIVMKNIGEMRVRLAVVEMGKEIDNQQYKNIASALKSLPKETASVVNLLKDESRADWVLRLIDPSTANKEYNLQIKKPVVLLLQGEGHIFEKRNEIQSVSSKVQADKKRKIRKVYGIYSATDTKKLIRELDRDLQKISQWQALSKIAGGLGNDKGFTKHGGVSLEISGLSKKKSRENNILTPGDKFEVKLTNNSYQNYWITLIYLGANYEIKIVITESLESKKTFGPVPVTIDDESFGAESLIVLSVPKKEQINKPDYDFLNQEGLGVLDRTRGISGDFKNLSPFQKILLRAKENSKGRTRGAEFGQPSNPQILSWNWVTVWKKK